MLAGRVGGPDNAGRESGGPAVRSGRDLTLLGIVTVKRTHCWVNWDSVGGRHVFLC